MGDLFWFELAEGGPRLIASPKEAALVPFLPWKVSRYIGAFLPGTKGDLIAGVNRGGFLAFRLGKAGEIVLYYHSNPYWEEYTAVSFFWHEGVPAALLARDRIFSNPEASPANPAVWGLDSPGGRFLSLKIPAFDFPGSEELDSLFWGNNGFWYYRSYTGAKQGLEYYKSPSLSVHGEPSAQAEYLAAATPLDPDRAPLLLSQALEAAAAMAGAGGKLRSEDPAAAPPISYNAAVVSPDFSSRRIIVLKTAGRAGTATQAAGEADLVELSAYYREGLALVLFPDGRGIFRTRTRPEGENTGSFALPALPEDFSYTGIGCCGPKMLIVSWEEQLDWNIGAAGFLMLEMNL
jgi:hypothetical protein